MDKELSKKMALYFVNNLEDEMLDEMIRLSIEGAIDNLVDVDMYEHLIEVHNYYARPNDTINEMDMKMREQFDENIAKAKEAKIELQDNINPNHYTDMAISPYEYVTKNGMNWEQGNAIKYISRYKNKNQAEDLKKAIKYIEMLIEREYNG